MPTFNDKSIQGIINIISSELPCIGTVSDKSIQGIITAAAAQGVTITDKSIQGIIDQLSGFSCVTSYPTTYFSLATDAVAAQSSSGQTFGYSNWFGGQSSGKAGGRYGQEYRFSGWGATSGHTINRSDSTSGSYIAVGINYTTPSPNVRLILFAHQSQPSVAYYLQKSELFAPTGGLFGSGTFTFMFENTGTNGITWHGIYKGSITASQIPTALSDPNNVLQYTTPVDTADLDTNMEVIWPDWSGSPPGTFGTTVKANSDSPLSYPVPIPGDLPKIVQADDPTGNIYLNSTVGDGKTWGAPVWDLLNLNTIGLFYILPA